MNQPNSEQLEHLRHSAAHLLAAAVLELYPDTKNTIGPSIENGFYYDFEFSHPISEDALPQIEQKMHELVQNWQDFERIEVSKAEALKRFDHNPYKQELINEFSQEGKTLTLYRSGEFIDLCRGGHIDNPSKSLRFFKLMSLAGAYWRGDEKNTMLTRIYGTAWSTQQELDDYLFQLEEAKKRDHKKVGKELDLFIFNETSPGMRYWLPKGLAIYNSLYSFARDMYRKYNYVEVATPQLNKSDLYKISGHWGHYQDDMFISNMGEQEVFGIKPMNCPNHMIIFGSKTRSHHHLPLRLAETTQLHRFELSGTLNGLFRTRQFRQDDAHIFLRQEQIGEEFQRIIAMTEEMYQPFGLTYRLRFGTRPEHFMGDPKDWDQAEKMLKEVLESSGKEFFEAEGEGAFYGPKVDILMKDSLGREWQTGTIQLDYQMPKNFDLKYITSSGEAETPVVMHRAILGSIERFLGVLIEHYAGAFPVWLAPVQAVVIPISDKHLSYAETVVAALQSRVIRVELDSRNESMGAKIRDAQMQKVPYMLVVGDKEIADETVAVRARDGQKQEVLQVSEFLDRISQQIAQKMG
jgi:threonyl-tRNA synthetase